VASAPRQGVPEDRRFVGDDVRRALDLDQLGRGPPERFQRVAALGGPQGAGQRDRAPGDEGEQDELRRDRHPFQPGEEPARFQAWDEAGARHAEDGDGDDREPRPPRSSNREEPVDQRHGDDQIECQRVRQEARMGACLDGLDDRRRRQQDGEREQRERGQRTGEALDGHALNILAW
jgi:hypothetical protein